MRAGGKYSLQSENEKKVAGVAGEVVSLANYHHGEASLEKTIVRMAQALPAARKLPLMLPIGEFGSRSKGYKDAAASRYIKTKENRTLTEKLFCSEDDYILEYEIIEGERLEPKYYAPIIPYVLCENYEVPASGWSVVIVARNVFDVIDNVRAKIKNPAAKCGTLRICIRDFEQCELISSNGKTYSVGNYSYREKTNTVTITELPFGTYSDIYLHGDKKTKEKKAKEAVPKKPAKKKAAAKESSETASEIEDSEDDLEISNELSEEFRKDIAKTIISEKDLVEDYTDNSTNKKIHIEIKLKPGAFEMINKIPDGKNTQFDGFEEYFRLKRPVKNILNLVNHKGEVVEYKCYEDILDDWFKIRQELYVKRVNREIILNDYRIKMLRNMQTFSKYHSTYDIKNTTKMDTVSEVLAENNYLRFDETLLNNPRLIPMDEFKKRINCIDFGADYNYLLKMNYRTLTKEAYEDRAREIKRLEDRQKLLTDDSGAFLGAKIWEYELQELEKVIRDGIASGWFYGKNKFIHEDVIKKT